MSGASLTSPYYFLGRLSMAVALSIRDKDPNVGREALKEYLESQATDEEHRERIRKVVKL